MVHWKTGESAKKKIGLLTNVTVAIKFPVCLIKKKKNLANTTGYGEKYDTVD
jgi:hypothetical protein